MNIEETAKRMAILNNKIAVLVDDGPENTAQVLVLNARFRVLSDNVLSLMNELQAEVEDMQDSIQ